MNFLKKIFNSLIYFSTIFFISIFILTIFYYFGIISYSTSNIFKLILFILSIFISGFINGKKSLKNGWLEGIKLSLIYLFVIFIITLLTSSFSLRNIIFYIIIIITCILSSMIGINSKKTK